MVKTKAFEPLEGKCVAFSVEEKQDRRIALFRLSNQESILLNQNGKPLERVIDEEEIDIVFLPNPILSNNGNPVSYWFEHFPSYSVNGNSSDYGQIDAHSDEALELSNYVRVEKYGEFV